MTGGLSNGENLRKRRQMLGLTQAELAERIGVPTNTVARWERGVVPIQHVRMLFRALNDVADEVAAETDHARRAERNRRVTALMPSI